MLRSILGFFIFGNGTVELHRGHFGLLFVINTYDKQPGQPAAIGEDNKWSSWSSSCVCLIEEDDEEYEGDKDDFQSDPLFLIGSFSALSSADFTLSRVHTLWYVFDEEEGDDTNFKSKQVSSKRFNVIFDGDGGKFKSWSLGTVVSVWCLCSAIEGELGVNGVLHLCR